MKLPQYETLELDKIVGGGQALGTLSDGKKALVWGGLPGEQTTISITKKKSHFIEGVVTHVLRESPERIMPKDPQSYLSTSPWQIMKFSAEQHYKANLIRDDFVLHGITLPNAINVYSDNKISHYRNKVEFSWYSDEMPVGETLDLAFYRRGSKGKVTIDQCALLPDSIMNLALSIRDLLHARGASARQLKTLLIRCNQQGDCVWQLYVKYAPFDLINQGDARQLPAKGGEVIYSDPKSPASRITKRLHAFGDIVLTDTVLDIPFTYATEGFFQINIPVYEQALKDMRQWVIPNMRVLDLYSGVGSIGLTIGGSTPELVEINGDAVREMKRNIAALHSSAQAILAPSEKALDYITGDKVIIVDPPRAGLHKDVVDRLLITRPPRIVYLSCNPATQARDVALLLDHYRIVYHQGYNFFPRTPHIEHLAVLERKSL